MAWGDSSTGMPPGAGANVGTVRSVSFHSKTRSTPLWRRTNTHGPLRQKTRFTRPDCPQQELPSDVIVTAHPQNATYGAVCFALKRPYVRFATAVIVVGASFLLQEVMVHHIGPGLPLFITFYPAIMLVAILAGLWPGLLATALAALGVDYLILPPVGHFAIARTSDAVALAFFAAMSVFMSLVAEHYRRSQRSFAAYKVEQAMRRSADEARHASEYRQLAFDAAGLGTWEFVPETGGLSVDDNCRKLFGFQPDQAGANGVLAERIHPEDSGKVDDTVKRSIAGADGGLWGMDYRVVWPDSSIHWLTSHGRAYFSGEDDSRRAIRLIGVNMDITDRKRAEEELRNSELRYAGLFNSMDEGFCIIEMIFDPEGKPVDYRFLEVNAAFERQTGLHDAVGKRMRELAPSIETHWFENYGKVALDGEPIHFCHESKALSRYFEAGAYRVGEPEMRQVAVVFSDITERKRAEKHIRQLNRVYVVLSDVNQTIVREKHSQAMLEAACRIAVDKGNFLMAWIGMVDPTTQTLEPVASSGLVDGYLDGARIDLRDQDNPNRLPGCAFQSGQFAVSNDIQNDPDYLPWRDDALRRGYRSAGSFPLKVDGRVEGVFNLYASEPGFFEGDELTLLTEMAMDISFALEVNRREEDRRRAEEELRWRTAFFEAQVDSALDGILVVDSQGKKILQNRRLNDLMKIPEDVSENADDAQQVQFVTKLMKDPEQFVQKVSWLYTHHEEVSRDELELHDGTIFERYSAPVMDKAQKHYGRIWRFRDITQQRQLEEQFRQAQKMEAVGQLTEGIAHDFNNLLTVILGCSEVLGEEVRQAPRLSKMADMISGAAQRGAELTHRMLAFAHRQTLQPRPINVNRLLADMSSFLRRTLSADIELEIIPGGKVCEALVDPTQLESALLNLCVNARDAMPD